MKIKKIFEMSKTSKSVPELVLNYKPSMIKKKPLTDSIEAAKFFRKIFDKGTIDLNEQVIIVPLDSYYRPIAFYKLAKGTRDECGFDQRDILQLIIATGADAFSIAHNHPMGPAIPSTEDIDASHSLRVRAEYFGVELFDHFIISKKGHYSFREHQLLWN